MHTQRKLAAAAASAQTPSPLIAFRQAEAAGIDTQALWLPATVLTPSLQGVEIAARREKHGWSQAELARRTGVPRVTIQRWERDMLAPTRAQAAALDRALALADPPAVLDPLGKRRSPVTLASYRRGQRSPNAGRKFPAEPLTSAEIAALLERLSDGKSGIRDRALTVLLWRSGLRIAEALALCPKDLDLGAGTVTVLKGKGSRGRGPKRRVVGIDALAVGYLQRWIDVRAQLGIPDARPDGQPASLFCTITRDTLGPGRPLNSSAYRQTLARAGKQAGIAKRVHPHGLRHTHAFELAVEHVPLNIVRAQLGHADLAMTQHYIDHLAPTAVIDAVRDRECPAELLPPTPAAAVTVISQGRPAPAPRDPAPAWALAGDPAATPVAPDPGRRSPGLAADARLQQRVLDLIAANGAIAQPQVRKALGIARSSASTALAKLQAKGLIVSAGYQRQPGRPPSHVWRLAPPKARITLQEPHDPREHAGPVARRGYGRERVLAAIAAADGRTSQAQLSRQLGVGSATIAHHCRALEQDGKLTRGGLDKTTSNRGSTVWRLAAPVRYTPTAARSITLTI